MKEIIIHPTHAVLPGGDSCEACYRDGDQLEDPCPEGVTVESLGISDPFSHLERCIQEGVCPRGCGELVVRSFCERVCPRCGFRHWSANPNRMPHATE